MPGPWLFLLLLMWPDGLLSQEPVQAPASIQPGQVVADVRCAANPSQGYALYLPSAYTPDRAWPVILAFDPGARGRTAVERYQAAAEEFGFIVVGSNNSRNGSNDTGTAVTSMSADVGARFHVDPRRVYTAGMSGGARVALAVALSTPSVAGVIASSAGYPDSKPRKTLTFAVFATAGTEDFNHLEMRELDRELTTPHRLLVFEGGHVWLSSDLAREAVGWMDIQAMKTGLMPRNQALLDRLFASRTAAVDPKKTDAQTYLALQAIVDDFTGFEDVTALAARAKALERDKGVRDTLKRDRDEDAREERALVDMRTLEARLTVEDQRVQALGELRQRWKELSQQARAAEDSPERRFSRRVLTGLSAGITTTDPDYQKIISEYRMGRGR